MSPLLDRPPFGPRDDEALRREMAALTHFHRRACPPYAELTKGLGKPRRLEDVPFVHVGLFKQMELRSEHASVRHQRVLKSSATTSGTSSRIPLDDESSRRQARSVVAILSDFIGAEPRPLLVLDDPRSLRDGGELPARVAAALSLKAMASDLRFVLPPARPVRWDAVKAALEKSGDVLVYGLTGILWAGWAAAAIPADVRGRLAKARVTFVHSGGWKTLEAPPVTRAAFEAALLAGTGKGSQVLDYYGLVEQVGIVYPLCRADARHVPVWADVIVRDPLTLEPRRGQEGQLQLMNPLPLGAPYHSVLTEDVGVRLPDGCPCGRAGRRFQLRGRIPQAEIRGCANG